MKSALLALPEAVAARIRVVHRRLRRALSRLTVSELPPSLHASRDGAIRNGGRLWQGTRSFHNFCPHDRRHRDWCALRRRGGRSPRSEYTRAPCPRSVGCTVPQVERPLCAARARRERPLGVPLSRGDLAWVPRAAAWPDLCGPAPSPIAGPSSRGCRVLNADAHFNQGGALYRRLGCSRRIRCSRSAAEVSSTVRFYLWSGSWSASYAAGYPRRSWTLR